ncbi:MAG TPA: argininosuccinate lyase [Gammaproteobacteria bacterium]|nr:argininosuccinate lyase [Gammaproteobacteria bacterium]HPI96463.1 argininosuccinate lyase [Gammaproteobacteria bacterium]HPQ88015.1 argininosuccinate lyase [Gammaproteobacteria bacterium]
MKNKNYLWSGEDGNNIHQDLMDFMAGNDIKLDRHLFVFDIEATKVHVQGLKKIGVFTSDEYRKVKKALKVLKKQFQSGEFSLDNRYEDGHSAIEFYLTEQLGSLGKKTHTGRSRNDQVLTCSRLFMRHHLQQIKELNKLITSSLLDLAEKHKNTAMPGYTHLQRAMPTTVAVWLLGFAESLIDDNLLIDSTISYINSSPLGTAAGFGVPLDLPREFTAKKLKFERVQINPVYAQNSRGKFDLVVLQTLYQVMLDIRRFSWDLSLFMTNEFNFVKLDKSYTTGSSIMPNKSNPDVVELMRASLSVIEGSISQIQSLMSLPSGYQRDLQMSKEPMVKSLLFTTQVLKLIPGLIDAMNFNPEVMKSAISPEMMATDHALEQVKKGKNFRDAYGMAKVTENNISYQDSIRNRISLGGAANLGIKSLRKRLDN